MKHNDVTSIDPIKRTNLANLFNIYEDQNVGNFENVYAINRTINLLGIDNINRKYYNNYVIKESDTWLSIAEDFYEDSRLWWLICKINNITNPMDHPVSGVELIILKSTFLEQILDDIRVG